jgi:hypothetical protein
MSRSPHDASRTSPNLGTEAERAKERREAIGDDDLDARRAARHAPVMRLLA